MESCLALIIQSVAHLAAGASFVTMMGPRCLLDARHQHHYGTLLMYTQDVCKTDRETETDRPKWLKKDIIIIGTH